MSNEISPKKFFIDKFIGFVIENLQRLYVTLFSKSFLHFTLIVLHKNDEKMNA